MPVSLGIAPRLYDAVPGLLRVNDAFREETRADSVQNMQREQAWAKVRADRIQNQTENDLRAAQLFLSSGGGGGGGAGGGGRGYGVNVPSFYAQTEAVNDRDARLARYQADRDANQQALLGARQDQETVGKLQYLESQRGNSEDERSETQRQYLLQNGYDYTDVDRTKLQELANEESRLKAQLVSPGAEARPKSIYPALAAVREQRRSMMPSVQTMTPEEVQRKKGETFIRYRDGKQVFDDGPVDYVFAPGPKGTTTRFDVRKKEGGGQGMSEDKLMEAALKAADADTEGHDIDYHVDRVMRAKEAIRRRLGAGGGDAGGGAAAASNPNAVPEQIASDMDFLQRVDSFQRSGRPIQNPETVAQIPQAIGRVRAYQAAQDQSVPSLSGKPGPMLARLPELPASAPASGEGVSGTTGLGMSPDGLSVPVDGVGVDPQDAVDVSIANRRQSQVRGAKEPDKALQAQTVTAIRGASQRILSDKQFVEYAGRAKRPLTREEFESSPSFEPSLASVRKTVPILREEMYPAYITAMRAVSLSPKAGPTDRIDDGMEGRLRGAKVDGPGASKDRVEKPRATVPDSGFRKAMEMHGWLLEKYPDLQSEDEETRSATISRLMDDPKDAKSFKFAAMVFDARQTNSPVKVETEEEAWSLPKGTLFVYPGGNTVKRVP